MRALSTVRLPKPVFCSLCKTQARCVPPVLLRRHRQVGFGSGPFLIDLDENGTDQAQQRLFIGKECCHTGAPLDFPVQALRLVGGSQPHAVPGRGRTPRSPQGCSHPSRRRAGAPTSRICRSPVSAAARPRRDPGHGRSRARLCDRTPHLLPRDVGLSVLLQMKLAALPRHYGKHRLTRRLEPGVIVRDEQLHSAQAPLLQRGEKRSPIHFGLRERHRDAQHPALARTGDAAGDEHPHSRALAHRGAPSRSARRAQHSYRRASARIATLKANHRAARPRAKRRSSSPRSRRVAPPRWLPCASILRVRTTQPERA